MRLKILLVIMREMGEGAKYMCKHGNRKIIGSLCPTDLPKQQVVVSDCPDCDAICIDNKWFIPEEALEDVPNCEDCDDCGGEPRYNEGYY